MVRLDTPELRRAFPQQAGGELPSPTLKYLEASYQHAFRERLLSDVLEETTTALDPALTPLSRDMPIKDMDAYARTHSATLQRLKETLNAATNSQSKKGRYSFEDVTDEFYSLEEPEDLREHDLAGIDIDDNQVFSVRQTQTGTDPVVRQVPMSEGLLAAQKQLRDFQRKAKCLPNPTAPWLVPEEPICEASDIVVLDTIPPILLVSDRDQNHVVAIHLAGDHSPRPLCTGFVEDVIAAYPARINNHTDSLVYSCYGTATQNRRVDDV